MKKIRGLGSRRGVGNLGYKGPLVCTPVQIRRPSSGRGRLHQAEGRCGGGRRQTRHDKTEEQEGGGRGGGGGREAGGHSGPGPMRRESADSGGGGRGAVTAKRDVCWGGGGAKAGLQAAGPGDLITSTRHCTLPCVRRPLAVPSFPSERCSSPFLSYPPFF